MTALQQIKSFLSSRFASVLIFFISIAGRIIQKIHFAGAGGDKAYQLQATKNLIAGHGISIHEVFANNLSQPQYIPLVKWPPGYSLLAAPFYSLDHNGFLWGSLWLDIIFALLFVWMARRIILLFGLPVYLTNIYCLVTGFFLYEFCSSGSTDLITIVFFQAALYLSLKLTRATDKKYATAFLIALLLFSSGLVRYLFIPVAFIIPLYFVISGLINHNKLFTGHGMFMFLTLAVMITGLFLFQQYYGGAATYIMETEKGFYPSSIPRMNPFLFSSFANTELLTVQLQRLSALNYITIGTYIRYFHFAILLISLVIFFQWLSRKKLARPDLAEHYFYIGSFSSLATIGVLCFLSLTNGPALVTGGLNWTFVDEARYYSVPIFFLQQLLFIVFAHYRHSIKKAGRSLIWLCMTALLLSTAHAVYYTIQRLTAGHTNFFFARQQFTAIDYSRQLLQKLVTENPEKQVVCAAADPMFNNFGALSGNIPGLYDYEKLNTLQLRAARETIIFVVVRDRDAFRLRGFLDQPAKQLVGSINDYHFYTLHVNPETP